MSQNEKPKVGERAEQLVDEAFRVVKLTRDCTSFDDRAPVANAVFVRAALIALVVHYNMGGSEVVDMARFAAWRLREEQALVKKEEPNAKPVG